MAKGYHPEEIRQKIIDALGDSETGMSGVEISEKIGINRITMSKYLKIFAAEGFLRQKNIGNVTLWFLEPGQESYEFPDDYFKVAPQYLDNLVKNTEAKVYSLIKNCIHSGASPSRLISEVVLPAIDAVQKMYDDGKIGNAEQKLLQNIISKSLHIFNQISIEPEPKEYPCNCSRSTQQSYFRGSLGFVSFRWVESLSPGRHVFCNQCSV